MMAALLTALVIGCGTHSAGPTAPRANNTGAVCLLNAFRDHCSPATYRLDIMGVDTIAERRFRIANCHVLVSESFRVVPQPAHTNAQGSCSGVRREAADIVATGCVGAKLPRVVSLTH
jgi:hypothetical protein